MKNKYIDVHYTNTHFCLTDTQNNSHIHIICSAIHIDKTK